MQHIRTIICSGAEAFLADLTISFTNQVLHITRAAGLAGRWDRCVVRLVVDMVGKVRRSSARPAEEVGGGLLYGGRRPEDGSTRGDGEGSTREEGIRGRKVGLRKLLRVWKYGNQSGNL